MKPLSWKSLLAGKGQLMEQRLHSGHVASKDTQQIHMFKCVVKRSAYGCTVYNNKKFHYYPNMLNLFSY